MISKFIFVVVTSLIMGGCSLLPDGRIDRNYYSFSNPECVVEKSEGTKKGALIIQDIEVPAFLNTQRIVYGRSDGWRGQYKITFWTEPVSNALSRLLTAQLECGGQFSTVEPRSTMVEPDYQLRMELSDFYHDVTSMPGKTIIDARVELIDLRKRARIAEQRFIMSEDVKDDGVASLVESFNLVMQKFDATVVGWLRESLPKK